jgi:hypothetical protein
MEIMSSSFPLVRLVTIVPQMTLLHPEKPWVSMNVRMLSGQSFDALGLQLHLTSDPAQVMPTSVVVQPYEATRLLSSTTDLLPIKFKVSETVSPSSKKVAGVFCSAPSSGVSWSPTLSHTLHEALPFP